MNRQHTPLAGRKDPIPDAALTSTTNTRNLSGHAPQFCQCGRWRPQTHTQHQDHLIMLQSRPDTAYAGNALPDAYTALVRALEHKEENKHSLVV